MPQTSLNKPSTDPSELDSVARAVPLDRVADPPGAQNRTAGPVSQTLARLARCLARGGKWVGKLLGGNNASEAGAPLFVWGVWALMLLVALAYVTKYGNNLPYQDEWGHVPILVGEQPVTAAWLWKSDGEHRAPLYKLLLVALYRLTNDCRAGMLFNVLALGALAALMIQAAKGLRGWTSYPDAFFPLVLLHLGHCWSFLLSMQVSFVAPVLIEGIILFVMVRQGMPWTLPAAAVAGGGLLLLPLWGPAGLAFVPALGLWLGYLGIRHWRCPEPRARRVGLFLLGAAAAALFTPPLYFITLRRSDYVFPDNPGLVATLRTSAQFLSMSIGHTAQSRWPWSGLAILGLLLVSVAAAAIAWWRQRPGALAALGLLAFMAGMASLALGLGWGRAGAYEWAGFVGHYVTLAVPALCCAYLMWVACGAAVGRFMQICLFILLCLLVRGNVARGLQDGQRLRDWVEILKQDLRAGVPVSIVVERHGMIQFPWAPAVLAEGLCVLRRAGVGECRHMTDDPTAEEVRLEDGPIAVNETTGQGLVTRSSMMFTLRKPRPVYAIRLRFSGGATGGMPPDFRLTWRKGRGGRGGGRPGPHPPWAPPRKSAMFWVNDTIDEIRLQASGWPAGFELSEVTLLVPLAGSSPGGRDRTN